VLHEGNILIGVRVQRVPNSKCLPQGEKEASRHCSKQGNDCAAAMKLQGIYLSNLEAFHNVQGEDWNISANSLVEFPET
jgi:hypothetical protein